jgi:5-methylcytosine-specific restriction endonuclease McrA
MVFEDISTMTGRKAAYTRYNRKRGNKSVEWNQLKRYGHIIELKECVRCGSLNKPTGKYLVIHHVDGNNGKQGKSLNNDRDNLVVLCKACHPQVHYRGELREVVA